MPQVVRTFWVPVTVSIGQPQPEPGQATALTQWVKVDVPVPESATVTAIIPFLEVPSSIPSKTPCEVTINGQPRKVAACVAKALAEVAKGAKVVKMRLDAYAKLREQAPEVRLRRNMGVKVIGKRAAFDVA